MSIISGLLLLTLTSDIKKVASVFSPSELDSLTSEKSINTFFFFFQACSTTAISGSNSGEILGGILNTIRSST